MNNFLKSLIYTLFVFLLLNKADAQLLSFPGAEGAGKYVGGGRGNITTAPKIFEVTSLVDNASSATTPGTLRYAVTNNSPSAPYRIVVFRVSGTIHLYAQLNLTRANTTIAGQTAPGGGITIADYPVYLGNNNIVVRYIRFRLGDKNQAASLGNDDAFGDNGGAKQKIMLDHCTMSWSNDEACSIYEGDSLSIQWCMISEPLDSSYHDEGAGVQQHAYGGIEGGKHASLHHNLYAHCRGRMPRFSGIRNGVADSTDFRNNVIYNWADYNTNGGEGGSYNVVNNYYKKGPNTPNTTVGGVSRRNMLIEPYKQASPAIPYGKYYLNGNYCFNSAAVTANNWLGACFSGGTLADTTGSKVAVPFNCVNINMQSALDAYQSVLQKAGCVLPYRDTLDERIVSNVINSTGKLINCQGGYPRGTAYATTATAWPFLPAGYTPTDTDHDGMPDVWETQRGLNPNSTADLNLYTSTTGYNNVETYLNGDTLTAPGILNTCVNGRVAASANSGNWLHLKDSSYGDFNSSRYLVSTDTNNLIISVYDNAAFGALNASYYTSSAIRTDANGKPYLNRNVTLNSSVSNTLAAPVALRMYISKKEYDDLRAADNTILSLADLRVIRSDNNSCSGVLPSSYTVCQPIATGVFGSYNNGYYINFQSAALGSFYITGVNTVLPVKLTTFKATAKESAVETNWTCTEEQQIVSYTVQKSKDAKSFVEAGVVAASNLSGTHQYNYTDVLPYAGRSYYRLKIHEFNGHDSYSVIAPVYFGNQNFLLAYPNPVKDVLNIEMNKAENSGSICITNTAGQVCLKMNLPKSVTRHLIDVKSLSPGMYVIAYQNGANIIRVRFCKTN